MKTNRKKIQGFCLFLIFAAISLLSQSVYKTIVENLCRLSSFCVDFYKNLPKDGIISVSDITLVKGNRLK